LFFIFLGIAVLAYEHTVDTGVPPFYVPHLTK
jgi:hypothetical protein